MTDTTTIQVRRDQAEQLQEIARDNGNYKTVIDRLLEDYNDTTTPDGIAYNDVREAAREAIRDELDDMGVGR